MATTSGLLRRERRPSGRSSRLLGTHRLKAVVGSVALSLSGTQRKLDVFLHWYNTQRLRQGSAC